MKQFLLFTIRNTHNLEYYSIRESVSPLTVMPYENPRLLKFSIPDQGYFSDLTQAIEISINGEKSIDHIEGSRPFQLNLHY